MGQIGLKGVGREANIVRVERNGAAPVTSRVIWHTYCFSNPSALRDTTLELSGARANARLGENANRGTVKRGATTIIWCNDVNKRGLSPNILH